MSDFISEKNTISPSPSPPNPPPAVVSTLSAPAKQLLTRGAPTFKWSSLWEKPQINHLNGKSYTLPVFNLTTAYGRNFHLAWLGFFVAFLSWFAFPPLLTESIKKDLNLTTAQIGNSNIVGLSATLIVRLVIGPFVDRYGPRKTMAAILIIGAIPSGLAGTVTTVNGLYVIRFFIGILGATFVPCLAWTSCFFDKSVVGAANGFAGGFGNLGGGVTYIVMISLYSSLVNSRGLSSAVAWRTSFAVVPVPILLFVAFITLWYGTDCPAGAWSARHTLPASAIAARNGHFALLDEGERRVVESKMAEKTAAKSEVVAVDEDEEDELNATTDLDIAVAEVLTLSSALLVIKNPSTWLCGLAYMTTFGFELAVDANLGNVLFASHSSKTFSAETAGYYAATFGLLNLFTRPMGGFWGDWVYRYYGIQGKKYLTLALGFLQGAMSLAMGLYMQAAYSAGTVPDLGVQMGLIVLMAFFCEVANGANFSLVPHCNSFNNGLMTGIVGAMGNVGGILFALIFRFLPLNAFSQAWWVAGIVAMGVNGFAVFLRVPKE